jgi:hypothetical protein
MSKRVQLTPTGSLSTQTSTLSNHVEDKPWNTKAIEGKTTRGEVDINSIFNNIVKVLLSSYKAKYKQTLEEKATEQTDTINPHIYIGLKKNDDLLFGGVIVNPPQGDGFVIDNTPYNRNFINNSKLYIMSIMANYKTDGSTLHNLINAEISKGLEFDLQKVVSILRMPPIIPVKPPIAPVKPPPLNTLLVGDLFKLEIYKEFGVKCTTAGECSKSIAQSFYILNEGYISVISNELIRNLYVTIFDYITGSDDLISAFGNKKTAYITCRGKASKALTAFTSLNKMDFVGVRTKVDFNIKKLIIGINDIRKDVNEYINVEANEDEYIKEI